MISGLQYIPHFVTDERQLLQEIDMLPWLTDMKRRVQHYGYRYDYKRRTVTQDLYLGALPNWLSSLAERLYTGGFMPAIPDQCIINEYEPGQGINAHVDCEPCFGDVICSISLGSACVMIFTNCQSKQKVELKLEPGSLVVMQGESRYDWTHGIPARKSDTLNDETWQRSRRVSITFRSVILKNYEI